MTELATFNVLASTGTVGASETQAWAPVAVTKDGSDYLTGKYWPLNDQSYHFYASNASLTFGATGSTVTADGSTDIVVAYLPTPSFKEKNTLTFNHIYARVGNFTLNTQSGYTLSGVSATLKDGVSGGTYNIFSGNGQTDGTGWSGLSAASDRTLAGFSSSTTAPVSSNDLWLVPGDYTISVTYTLNKGDYSEQFTKTGTVSLVAGKTNTITATAVGGSATEIKFGVSVTAWSANAIEMAWEPDANGHDYVDLGLRVGGNKILFATCNIGASSPEEYGDYFAWGETSKRYISIDYDTLTEATFELSNAPYHTGYTSTNGWTKYIPTNKSVYWSGEGSPDNKTVLDLSDDVVHVLWGGDWRMPTIEELCMLINGDGTSTDVDMTSNVTYVWTSNYNSTGVAGFVITGTGEFSSASLFLPAAGYIHDSVRETGYGRYGSRSLDPGNPSCSWHVYFDDMDRYLNSGGRSNGQSVRPVIVVPE